MKKTWTILTLLLALWLGGLGSGFLLGAREHPGIPSPLAARGETSAAAPETSSGAATGPAAETEAPPTTAAGGQETEDTGGPPSTFGIVEKDFKLVPNDVTVKAGAVTFVLKNEGRYTHDFRVNGQGIDKKAPRIGAGHTYEFHIDLKPGTYQISCPISNHAKRGMTGTLTVVG